MSEESWPDHSAELARKAMERISADIDRFQKHEIKPGHLWLIADVLSEVTQGLIPNETWQTIYAVRQEATKLMKKEKR